jgi:hypothetical protein
VGERTRSESSSSYDDSSSEEELTLSGNMKLISSNDASNTPTSKDTDSHLSGIKSFSQTSKFKKNERDTDTKGSIQDSSVKKGKKVKKVYPLKVKKINKVYETLMRGKFYALKDVSFKLKKNEIYALLGSNGAGKTTLMSILTNLLEQTSGRVIYSKECLETSTNTTLETLSSLDSPANSLKKILEETLEEDKTDLERIQNTHYSNYGVCPQFDIFWPSLTVREHLSIFSMLNSSILYSESV